MLATLMYHRISETDYPDDITLFARHLEDISQEHPVLLPGEAIPRKSLSLCLSFDDAYFDFYHHVFPLLKRLQLKAILAVPTQFILDDTSIDSTARLQVPYHDCMLGNTYQTHAPFCTWEEIREMVGSGLIEIASHSHSHADLSDPDTDLEQEIKLSKQIIETKIEKPINCFVYPYGKMNRRVQKQLRQQYTYVMRIGSSLNRSWQSPTGLTYRIDADHFWPHNIRWQASHTRKYFYKYINNIIRFK